MAQRIRILELDLCLLDALRRLTKHQQLILQLDPSTWMNVFFSATICSLLLP
ncbi:hypothetical protein H8959_013053, partial [Pygathrix nigripes]